MIVLVADLQHFDVPCEMDRFLWSGLRIRASGKDFPEPTDRIDQKTAVHITEFLRLSTRQSPF